MTATPPAPASPPAQPTYAAPPQQGLALTSLITGIGSIVFAFAFIGLAAGIAAVVTGNMAKTRQPYARSFWYPGLITGWIGIGLSVLVGILTIVFVILYFAVFAYAFSQDGAGSSGY